MLDREVGLTGPDPEHAAPIPAASEARVERQRTIDQPDHGADILAEIRQRLRGIGEGARVVLRHLERLSRKSCGLATVGLRRFGPAVIDQPHVVDRRPGKRRPVIGINRDRLLEQSQGRGNPLFRNRIKGRKRAQVEIVGAEVSRWPRGGSAHLGGLQSWLDDPGDADRYLVLKLEDVLQRAVEAVGPEMRSTKGVNQLRGDAYTSASL